MAQRSHRSAQRAERGAGSQQQRRPSRAATLRLLDDARNERDEFDVGESVFVAATGLKAATVYDIVLDDDVRASLMSDRHGEIPATAVVPYLGLTLGAEDPERAPTLQTAQRELGGRTLSVQARAAKRTAAKATLAISEVARRPLLLPTDEGGRLRTGVLAGDADIAVTVRNFPAGCLRLFLVPRQFEWHVGDRIEPVRDAAGVPVVVTTRVDDSGSAVVSLLSRERALPGSYQVVARAYRPGTWDADDLVVLAGDVLSSRRFTSIVVRSPIELVSFEDGGTVLTPEIAGRPVPGAPYFQFVNNFPKGTDVYAALDPAALPAGLVGQKAAIYVIPHRSAADWALDTSLTDVSGPGMTPAVEIAPIVPGCINWNETLVWPNPQVPGKYDIVVDFGNNHPDPSQFATDATFDDALDMIDGYVRVGFHVTEDPSLPGPYAGGIGRHSYTNGTVQVPSTHSGPMPTAALDLKAVVRYPAVANGIDAAFKPGSFPLVVMVHGNSGMPSSYLGYDYLLDHLAGHGFVAMSIYAPVDSMIEVRARAIFEHLAIMAQKNALPGLFNGHVDFSHVGIMGHSRGGEAVVRAAQINTGEGLGWNLDCGVAIAPTDFFHYGDPGMPLAVVYGSNDGDVAGWWSQPPTASFTGFDLYDEAGRPRSFVFAYGATHDRFNSEWASTENTTELYFPMGSSVSSWGAIHTADLPKLIPEAAHQAIVKGYATAYMQLYLQSRAEQVEYFLGALKPAAVTTEVHVSHQEAGTQVVDSFEQLPHDAATNSLGAAVTPTALAAPPVEDWLHSIDSFSPHMTAGGDVAWTSSAGVYMSSVPAANADISAYSALSFRVSQRYGSAHNPAAQAQECYVRLTDGAGNSRAIRSGAFMTIPYPYERGVTSLIKSALKTVRIPLASYVVANAGAQIVDLTDITSIAFGFTSRPTGEIALDDIELVP